MAVVVDGQDASGVAEAAVAEAASRASPARGLSWYPVGNDAARCRHLDAHGCRCLLRVGHASVHDCALTPWLEVLAARRAREKAGGE